MAARVRLEQLLKARKLDVTLMSARPRSDASTVTDAADLAGTGVPAIDAALGGGLRRGHVSEIVGGRSSGRTTVVGRALSAAAARGELVALIDPCDRFDPASAAAFGLDLTRLLWIRDTGDAPRALKAMNLVLQAGGFGLVVLDLADVALPVVRAQPFTTWFRLARVIEGSQTVALLVAAEHVARGSGGATIDLERGAMPARVTPPNAAPPRTHARWNARWRGCSDRSRLLQGLEMRPRVVGARS
jgi:hypothetical protein